MAIDKNEVKAYNQKLKELKEKYNSYKANAEFLEGMLSTKCAQLSEQLGISVTEDNIADIISAKEREIEQLMEAGKQLMQIVG